MGSDLKNDYLRPDRSAYDGTVQPESTKGTLMQTSSAALVELLAQKSAEPYLIYFGKPGAEASPSADSEKKDIRQALTTTLSSCCFRTGLRTLLTFDKKEESQKSEKKLREKYQIDTEAVVLVSATGEKLKVFSGSELNPEKVHAYIHQGWPELRTKLRIAEEAKSATSPSSPGKESAGNK